MQTFKRKAKLAFTVEVNDNAFELQVGKEYDTSALHEDGTVTVFSRYWVRVPIGCFDPDAVEFTVRDAFGDMVRAHTDLDALAATLDTLDKKRATKSAQPESRLQDFDLLDSEGQLVSTGNWVEYKGKHWVVGACFAAVTGSAKISGDGVLALRRTSRFFGRKEQAMVNCGHVKCAGE